MDRLGYRGARRVLVLVGLAALVALTLGMALRDVEMEETVAVALFIPVFLAFVAFDVLGGLVAALVATCLYIAMRFSAIEAVGVGRFLGLIASRGIAFVVFGMLGGIANQVLKLSLVKLDVLDTMDDATTLYNAKFFVETTGLEMSRASRYGGVFSIATLDVPAGPIDSRRRKARAALLLEFGKMLNGGARTVDRVAVAYDGTWYRVAAILPETAKPGAEVFASRMADRVGVSLFGRGVAIPPDSVRALSFPEDEAVMAELRKEFGSLSDRQLDGGRLSRRS